MNLLPQSKTTSDLTFRGVNRSTFLDCFIKNINCTSSSWKNLWERVPSSLINVNDVNTDMYVRYILRLNSKKLVILDFCLEITKNHETHK